MPTDIVNSVTIKLEPGLDQIIDTETYNNNQDDQVMENFRQDFTKILQCLKLGHCLKAELGALVRQDYNRQVGWLAKIAACHL